MRNWRNEPAQQSCTLSLSTVEKGKTKEYADTKIPLNKLWAACLPLHTSVSRLATLLNVVASYCSFGALVSIAESILAAAFQSVSDVIVVFALLAAVAFTYQVTVGAVA
ncbi:hypothetical protein PT286_09840 [Neisseriaceae bacterium ESL0693]|nr:hypothetical protein [Neisseriaceae bacterium ESL0693]